MIMKHKILLFSLMHFFALMFSMMFSCSSDDEKSSFDLNHLSGYYELENYQENGIKKPVESMLIQIYHKVGNNYVMNYAKTNIDNPEDYAIFDVVGNTLVFKYLEIKEVKFIHINGNKMRLIGLDDKNMVLESEKDVKATYTFKRLNK